MILFEKLQPFFFVLLFFLTQKNCKIKTSNELQANAASSVVLSSRDKQHGEREGIRREKNSRSGALVLLFKICPFSR